VQTRSYQYDAADRLMQVSVGPTPTTLTYDNAGELLSFATGTTTAQFTYDPQGNRTQRTDLGAQTRTYGWDQANRLVTFTGPPPGSQQPTQASYTYNGDGLRQSKTVNGVPEAFTYDMADGLPLILRDGTSSFVTGPGGLPLEQIAADGTVTYFHADRLGSTRALTNASGLPVASYAYDPYGNVLSVTGQASTPLQYAGQYTDAETGLQYLRARYYDPATAQFVSRDPWVSATRQAYAYAGSNPQNGTDPSGMWCPATPSDCILPFVEASNCVAHFGDCVRHHGCDAGSTDCSGRTQFNAAGTLLNKVSGQLDAVASGGLAASAFVASGDAWWFESCPVGAAERTPPGFDPRTWVRAVASRDIPETHWWDPGGGEWRWHAADKWHPQGHWDYNPWDTWNSPWRHINAK
jgi:RHS repeat-associated protein